MGKICNDKVPSSCVVLNSESDTPKGLHKCAFSYPLSVSTFLAQELSLYRLLKTQLTLFYECLKLPLRLPRKNKKCSEVSHLREEQNFHYNYA